MDAPNEQENIEFQRTIKQLATLGIKESIIFDHSSTFRDEISYRIIRNEVNLSETMELFYIDSTPLFGQNCYTVTALFPYGESNPTDLVCVEAELSSISGDVNMDGGNLSLKGDTYITGSLNIYDQSIVKSNTSIQIPSSSIQPHSISMPIDIVVILT